MINNMPNEPRLAEEELYQSNNFTREIKYIYKNLNTKNINHKSLNSNQIENDTDLSQTSIIKSNDNAETQSNISTCAPDNMPLTKTQKRNL